MQLVLLQAYTRVNTIMRGLIALVAVLLLSPLAAAESTFSPARPPAIPLAVRSPYLSSMQWSILRPMRFADDEQHGSGRVQLVATEAISQGNGRPSGMARLRAGLALFVSTMSLTPGLVIQLALPL